MSKQITPDKAKSQSLDLVWAAAVPGTLIGAQWLLVAVAVRGGGGVECCALHKCDCDSAEQKQLLCH